MLTWPWTNWPTQGVAGSGKLALLSVSNQLLRDLSLERVIVELIKRS
jgi:hypothetical protein